MDICTCACICVCYYCCVASTTEKATDGALEWVVLFMHESYMYAHLYACMQLNSIIEIMSESSIYIYIYSYEHVCICIHAHSSYQKLAHA